MDNININSSIAFLQWVTLFEPGPLKWETIDCSFISYRDGPRNGTTSQIGRDFNTFFKSLRDIYTIFS